MSNKALADSFFKHWDAGETVFPISSSGSTGTPKTILLERQWMVWSARQTAAIIQPKQGDVLLCCLPLDKVGGLMMLVRSRVWGIPVQILEPASEPLPDNCKASIVSLSPHQLYKTMSSETGRNKLGQFREVLIGGGDIDTQLERRLSELPSGCRIRHSYGMSETYSHIALRSLNGPEHSEYFSLLPGIEIRRAADTAAEIKTPYFSGFIKTNDAIELLPDGRFKVLGRLDFVINSGGVKLHPRQLEQRISEVLKPAGLFLIAGLNDAVYGQRPVLVCENAAEFSHKNFDFLKAINPYAVPVHIMELKEIPLNAGGKTDRLQIAKMINRQ